MADQKYKITDYDLIDELQPEDSLLVARLSEYKYYKLTWSIIKEKLDSKANAVNTATIGTFGLAKVNEQGIVTDIKVLADSDIPELPISKITNLQNSLDAKADKTFASFTSNFVLGETSNTVSTSTKTIDEKEVSVSTVTITKKSVNPNTNGNKTETVNISSKDGSIQFEKNNTGDILLSVDIDNCQKQSDWAQSDNTKVDYIKNKPELATVATSGSYNDLSNNPTFISGDDSTLTIEKSADSNQYTFTGLVKGEWGKIIGNLSDQSDLSSKFAEYYTSAQVDSLIADIDKGLLKVKGYVSETDPLDYIPELSEGILWLQSSIGGAPSGSIFICNKLIIPEEPEEPYWDNTYRYEAKNFDVWINKNESGNDKSYFWLESEWEQLDFTIDLTPYAKKEELARVSFSGSYNDLNDKPTYATVATTGSYNDLNDKPTIPAAQIQSDWEQENITAVDYIKNKPTYATVATTGSYNDLNDKPTIPAEQVQSDWEETDTAQKSFIQNKPTIPTGVNIHEEKVLLSDEDYDFDFKYINIPDEYLALNFYSVDIYWNGIFLNEIYDYIWLLISTVQLEPEDLVVGANLGDALFSTVSYVQRFPPVAQTNWEIVFTNGLKVVSSTENKRLYIYVKTNEEEGYVLETELYTSLDGITYEEFLQNCQWSSSYLESDCIIESITGTVDIDAIGSNPKTVCYLPDGPEAGDTEDIFTFVFKTAELTND